MNLDLVDPLRWAQLDARLRDAVTRNPSNAAAVEVIRAPVVTLRLLARDATAVLAGDPLAAERMRVTLHAAAEAAALVPVATAALGKQAEEAAPPPLRLVRMQALAVVEAAAMMVADDAPGMRFALLVVTGLALQCGPAELLARLEPFGAPADSYDNLVRLAVPPIVAAGVASRVHLRGHARDPLERARWRCLLDIAGRVATSLRPGELATHATADAAPVWTVATADAIDAVEVDGDALVLHGAFPFAANGWPADGWAVVGARPPASPLIATVDDATDSALRVRFAAPVAWVGLVDRARRDRVARARARLRGVLVELAGEPCVRRDPPQPIAELVPALDDGWPVAVAPPRHAGNQPPAGSTLRTPGAGGPAEHPGEVDPDTGGPVGPGPGTAEGGPTEVPGDDQVDLGHQVVVVARVVAADRELVVPASELAELLIGIGRRLDVAFDVIELPWVEDALAVTATAPTGDDDPRVPPLLEALARAAARTPGREDALWLAVVPSAPFVSVTAPADAARGVAVTSRAGLTATLMALLPPAVAAPGVDVAAGRYLTHAPARFRDDDRGGRGFAATDRMRLVGRLVDDELTLLEPARVERRAAGPGAPLDTGLVAVALDGGGREVGRVRIRGHRDGGPVEFAALVPVVAEAATVELRHGDRVLARLPRWDEPPRWDAAAAAPLALDPADGVITARWSSPRVAAPVALTVEVSDDGERDWVPMATVHACAAAEALPLWRLARAGSVRLVACDGWHAIATAPRPVPETARFGPVAIRRVHDRLLWAEVPAGAQPEWAAGGATAAGRTLPAPRAGAVRLSLDVGGARVTDTTELGGGADGRR